MISVTAYNYVVTMIKYCCYFQVVPYTWDSVSQQLKPMNKLRQRIFFNLNVTLCITLSIFSGSRLAYALTLKNENGIEIPPRVVAMAIVWTLGYTLSGIVLVQFYRHGVTIGAFGNSVIDALRKSIKEKQVEKNDNNKIDYISGTIVFAGMLMYINPWFHGFMMLDTPCAPQFSTSLRFPCETFEENTHTIIHKIPFFFLESYFAYVMLTPWTFNWHLVFLGLVWLREELGELTKMVCNPKVDDRNIVLKYKTIQSLMTIINDGFIYYLTWFPLIMLGIVSFLLFACIRFYGIGWKAYGMFPSCFVQCLFESLTPLAVAGKVNEDCINMLQIWKNRGNELNEKRNFHGKLRKSLQKSCKKLECTSGGMYTFENSIVLITISNCVILTLNLLLLFPSTDI